MKHRSDDYEAKALRELERAYVEPLDDGTAAYHVARAQVYATLALASTVDDHRAVGLPIEIVSGGRS